MPPSFSTELAKLAALRATIDQRIARDIRMSGTSRGRTDELLAEYISLREVIRSDGSGAFAEVSHRLWSTSIASQAEVLREVRSEADYILALGSQLGLFQPVALSLPPAAEEQRTGVVSWARDHVSQLILALVAA